MQTPNIFLHYYNSDEVTVSFQEIIQSDVAPEILERIQKELVDQLTSFGITEKLPNFDWQNVRMQEKWQTSVNLLLPNIVLPNYIWQEWIASLTDNSTSTTTEIPSFADLLTADIYYKTPSDSLPDLIEPEEELVLTHVEEEEIAPIILLEEETMESVDPIHFEITEVTNQASEELPSEAPIQEVFQQASDVLVQTPVQPAEEEFEPQKSKSINDIHAETSGEKVLDTIHVTDYSLKNMVEINMTHSLGESISLFQKLNFIQDLFEGNADEFKRLIEFVDQKASATQWKSEIEGLFSRYQHSTNEDTWNEFYILVDRKFN
jgi:hypothetical protein